MSVTFCLSVPCCSTSCILPKIYVFCDVMPWLMVNSNILKGHSTIFRLKPGIQNFSKNCRNHLKFLYARRLTRRKFDTEYLQICGAVVQNLVPGISAPLILQSEKVLLFGLYDILSPGIDHIPAELIKAGGRTICSEIHKLIIPFGIRRSCLRSRGNRSLYLSIREAIKLIVVITRAYHYCHICTKFYPTSCSLC